MKLLLPFSFLLFITIANAQTTRYVKQNASGNGTSWADASGNLQSIINSSSSGDQIWIAAGTFQPTINTSFSMKEGVIIYGGFPNSGNPTLSERNFSMHTTVLQGNGASVIFNENSDSPLTSATILDGVTITGGTGMTGGGIVNNFSAATYKNLKVTGNTAIMSGGGISNFYANSTFINVLIHHNNVTGEISEGGGIENAYSEPTYINCVIAHNTAAKGAAAVNKSSATKYRNTIFFENNGTGTNNPTIINYMTATAMPTYQYCFVHHSNAGTPQYNTSQWEYSFGSDIGGNIDGNPMLNADYTLQAASPCINAGKNSHLPAGNQTDLFGNTRIVDVVDIGVYEFGVTVSPILYAKVGATGTGNSWADAGNLSLLIKKQVTGGEIWVAEGTYVPLTEEVYFKMREGVKYYGGFAVSGNPTFSDRNPETFETILKGGSSHTVDNHYREEIVLSASSVLDGFTIVPGEETFDLTGIYNWFASPTLKNLKIINHREGGMRNLHFSSPNISNSTFSGNSAPAGAAMLNAYNCHPVMDNCIVENNIGQTSGGGIWTRENSSITIDNSIFRNNLTTNHGGGVAVTNAVLTVRNSSFIGNSAGWGSAILSQFSVVDLENVIATDNFTGAAINIEYSSDAVMTNVLIANNKSGGMWNVLDSDLVMTNVTIANNTFENSQQGQTGAGMWSFAPLVMRNCIIWGNVGLYDHNINTGYAQNKFQNCIIGGSGGSSNWTSSYGINLGGNLDVDPAFVFAEGYDFRLSRCSPAINAGITSVFSNGAVPDLSDITLDLNNEPRFWNNGIVDIGAYEYQNNPLDEGVTYYVNGAADGANTGQNWENAFKLLQQALSGACPGDTIWVAENTYTPATNNSFVMKDAVAIYGGFPANGNPTMSDRNWGTHPTKLQGNGSSVIRNNYTALTAITSTAILDGFTIEGGSGHKFLPLNPPTFGGGILNRYASPTLSNLLVQNNTAFYGGGIYSDNSAAILTNVAVVKNTGSAFGAGIYSQESALVLNNVTLAQNIGSAYYIYGTARPTFKNSIVYGNTIATNPAVDGQALYQNSLIQGSGATWNASFGTNLGGNIDANPLFTESFRLSAGSPAINSANATLYPATALPLDLAGNSRIYGTGLDMGAYEFDPNLSIVDLEQIGIQYWPNPVKTKLFLSGTESISNIKVYSMLGQLLLDENCNWNQGSISMENLSKGSYLVSITSEAKTASFIIVK